MLKLLKKEEQMKHKVWSPQLKMKIILEHLVNQRPLAELCNEYGLRQSTYHYWLKELERRGHIVFEYKKNNKKEQKLLQENKRLKQIIAELSIELKKTELELNEEDRL